MAARKCRDREETKIGELAFYFYDASRGWTSDGGQASGESERARLSEFSVVTWNCWAVDEHAGAQRYAAIGRQLAALAAEFVALQEVTALLLRALASEPAVQRLYAVSDVSGRTFAPCFYGVVLLVRRDVLAAGWRCRLTTQRLPTTMSRQMVAVELAAGDATLALATTHLESTYELGFMRRIQLEEVVFPRWREHEHVVFVGDMNTTPRDKENELFAGAGFVDAWCQLAPAGDDGGTTMGVRSKRIDRVFYRSPALVALRYEKFGAERVVDAGASSPYRVDTASDHFGVKVDFGWLR